MPAPKPARTKVLRVAVVIDDLVCDEVHQSVAGPISVGTHISSDVILFGSRAPTKHSLFDFRQGHYFLDVPPHVKGKISLGRKAMTISAMRKRFGKGDKLRVKLSPRAKGKLMIGESQILFQFDTPKPIPAKLPFPKQFNTTLDQFWGKREQASIAASAAVLGSWFVWAGTSDYEDSFDVDDLDERFVQAMGIVKKPKKEAPPPEEEDEEDELALEEEDEKVLDDKPKPEPKLSKKPEKFSSKALSKARSVGVARVLGTYGGPGEGTVFDVIDSTENNLAALFDQGMTSTTLAQGGDIGPYVPGGEGIDQFGTAVENRGLTTSEGPNLEKNTKKERKVRGRAKATKTDIFGDVDKKKLRAYINRRTSALRSCYERALRTSPDLSGKMTYTIEIGMMGNVTRVAVEEDTLGSGAIKSCTTGKIRGWRFPKGEDTAEVTFSVIFSGGA
ncbi:MAG: AgmX/PglI C-terminal domain-containing protein [Nannocystaceae bacterium]|nr:AgmX/PglI C-terminal domain-containing protein [Nannocystaceae bacterium]